VVVATRLAVSLSYNTLPEEVADVVCPRG